MLQLRVRILIAILLLLVAGIIFNQVRRRKLDLRYTLSWILLVIVLAVLTLFPGLLNLISKGLGIYSPVNMIFFFGFVFALVIIYSLTVAVSKQASEIRSLAQEIALLKKKNNSSAHEQADSEE